MSELMSKSTWPSFRLLLLWNFYNLITLCSGQCDTSQYLTYQNGGTCYKIFTDFLNRDDSARKCQSIGYELLEIKDASEHQFIKDTFLRVGGLDRTWMRPKEELSQYFVWVADNEDIKPLEDNTQYCYQDLTRTFLGFPVAAVNSQTECKAACERNGNSYKFYGVRFYSDNGIECFCGDSFDRNAQQWVCDRPCTANPSQICGSNYDAQTRMYPGILIKPLTPPVDFPSYVGWGSRQPDNVGGYEMCIALEGKFTAAFNWLDSKCSERNYYVCQYNQRQSECQSSFRTYSSFTGKCYRIFNNERVDFYTAKFRCINDGGSLLKIENEDVDDEIKEALKAFPQNTFINQADVWIGATKSKWLSNNQETNFYSFAEGQPTAFNRNCMVLSRNAGGRDSYNMEDYSCSEIAVYTACKLQVGPQPPPATRPPIITPVPTPAPTPAPTAPPTRLPNPTQPPVIQTNPPLNTAPASTPQPQPTPLGTSPPIFTSAPVGTTGPGIRTTFFDFETTQVMKTPKNPDDTNVINPNPQKSTGIRKITNGVIIAIVIVGTALLVGLIKLTVSCCQGRNGGDEKGKPKFSIPKLKAPKIKKAKSKPKNRDVEDSDEHHHQEANGHAMQNGRNPRDALPVPLENNYEETTLDRKPHSIRDRNANYDSGTHRSNGSRMSSRQGSIRKVTSGGHDRWSAQIEIEDD